MSALLLPAIVASIAGNLFLTSTFLYLYLQEREDYMRIWTASWAVYTLRSGFQLWEGQANQVNFPVFAEQLTAWLSGLLLLWGTYVYMGRRLPGLWRLVALAGVAWLVIAVFLPVTFFEYTLPMFLLLGIAYIWIGVVLLRSEQYYGAGKYIAGIAFLLWGVHKLDYPLLRPLAWFAPWGFLIASLLAVAVAVGILLIFDHRVRHELSASEARFRNKVYQQERLIEAARSLTQSLELQAVLTRIGQGAKDILGAYGCTLYLLEADGRTLTPVVALEEYSEEVLATPLDIDHSLTGKAVRAGHGLIFNNAYHEPDGMHIPGTPQDVDERIIATPFKADGQVLGAMCLNRMGEYFTEEDLALVETFAAYASSALKNAQQHQRMQQEMEARLQAQQALLESEERYRSLFEHTQSVMLLVDPRSGHILDANPAACQFYGFPKETLTRKTIQEINTQPEEITLQQLEEAIHNQRSHCLGEHRLADGSLRQVEEFCAPITFHGRDFVFAIVHDVTERVQREREMQLVGDLAEELRAAQMLEEILPVVTDMVMDHLRADRVVVAMRQPRRGENLIEFVHGNTPFKVGDRLPAGKGLLGHVIASGKPYLTNDPLGDSHLAIEVPEIAPRAMAAVPLIDQEETIGALIIGRQHPITEAELRLLTVVGEMAAGAIRRASLYAEKERQLNQLKALHTIDRAITTNLELESTLNTLLNQITSLLRVDAAAFLLLEKNVKDPLLFYAASSGFRTALLAETRFHLGDELAGKVAANRQLVALLDLRRNGRLPRLSKRLMSAEGFVGYVGVPLLAHGQVKGVLELFHRQPLKPDEAWWDLLDALSQQSAIAIDNISLFEGLRASNLELYSAYEATLRGWAKALELRDKETQGHSERVTALTMKLAETLGVSAEERLHIQRGTMLHDIGKMGIPDSILQKPGPLDEGEWVIMRQHPVFAYDLLAPIKFLEKALEIPYCHHERWDGSGYPRGLKGEEIPLAARIFAVVDVYDALLSNRPYRPAWSQEEVHAYLREQSGKYFDPRVVKAFLEMIEGQEG